MSAAPYHKRYHGDALTGFMSLTLEERGAYQTLLDLIYDRGGALPDNPRLLAGFMGCSLRKWSALRAALLTKGKIHLLADGSISNSRAEKELENYAKTSRKHAENGAKGGRKKAENSEKANENNEGGNQRLGNGSTISEARSQKPEEEKEESNRADGAAPLVFSGKVIRLNQADFAQWRRAYPDVDLMATLQARDDWLNTEADAKTRKRWFIATSNHLANLQQKATAAKRSYDRDRITV